jgi:radical S-adenosyl methionine domain-containing protein 2
LAKKSGPITSIVTNGSLLTDKWLKSTAKYLDWIGVSIDSIDHETNVKHGRCPRDVSMGLDYYCDRLNMIKKYGINLKINTVVTSCNKDQRLHEIITIAKPKVWKIFQVMKMDDVNSFNIDKFLISESEFDNFINNHRDLKEITTIKPENNYSMTGSYLMVDPSGRFCDDTTGRYNYSEPILKVGIEKALSQIKYDEERYKARKFGL